eukprot:1157245-Pelagomonas_calceolata.AAC.7
MPGNSRAAVEERQHQKSFGSTPARAGPTSGEEEDCVRIELETLTGVNLKKNNENDDEDDDDDDDDDDDNDC